MAQSGSEPIRLDDYQEVTAFYVMADLRGFSLWSRKNQTEVKKLSRILYSLARAVFGWRSSSRLNRRVVKFLGDGFFAVNEYDDDDITSFTSRLSDTATSIRRFIPVFHSAIAESNLHDREEIRVSFGMSFGASFRFHLPGESLDYIGEKVNFAARLCSVANPSELVIEHDLLDHIESLGRETSGGLGFRQERVNLKSYGECVIGRSSDAGDQADVPGDYRELSALVQALNRSGA